MPLKLFLSEFSITLGLFCLFFVKSSVLNSHGLGHIILFFDLLKISLAVIFIFLNFTEARDVVRSFSDNWLASCLIASLVGFCGYLIIVEGLTIKNFVYLVGLLLGALFSSVLTEAVMLKILRYVFYSGALIFSALTVESIPNDFVANRLHTPLGINYFASLLAITFAVSIFSLFKKGTAFWQKTIDLCVGTLSFFVILNLASSSALISVLIILGVSAVCVFSWSAIALYYSVFFGLCYATIFNWGSYIILPKLQSLLVSIFYRESSVFAIDKLPHGIIDLDSLQERQDLISKIFKDNSDGFDKAYGTDIGLIAIFHSYKIFSLILICVLAVCLLPTLRTLFARSKQQVPVSSFIFLTVIPFLISNDILLALHFQFLVGCSFGILFKSRSNISPRLG